MELVRGSARANSRSDGDGVGRVGMDADRLGADPYVSSGDRRDLALRDRARAFGGGDIGVFCFMLAGDDQAALVVIVEVGVKLGEEAMAARGIDLLVQGAEHADQRAF